jgi:parallel beta-helix repeat protein
LFLSSAGRFSQGVTITVGPGKDFDFETVQAGIDASEDGDTVTVAAGVYYENVSVEKAIYLSGAGADVTIIDAGGFGDVVDVQADDVTISGFTLRNSGIFDLGHMNCGVYIWEHNGTVVSSNIVTASETGIGIWHAAGTNIRNNIIENNSDGLYIYGSEDAPCSPAIVNNTIVDNIDDGITLRVMVSPVITNNIITGNYTGINSNYVTGSPAITYNDLWNNDVNYMRDNQIDDTLAGPGSMSAGPLFADPNNGDYHLKSQAGRWDSNSQIRVIDNVTSPCIDAGDPNSSVGYEPEPSGGVINMGAYGGSIEASMTYYDVSLLVDVNEDDDGGLIELETGQVLVVTLESNPTTGYRWEVQQVQASVIGQIGGVEFKPFVEDGKPVVGAGGWEIFRFRAVGIGQVTLQMVYHKSWEEDAEPLRTFTLDVAVN